MVNAWGESFFTRGQLFIREALHCTLVAMALGRSAMCGMMSVQNLFIYLVRLGSPPIVAVQKSAAMLESFGNLS